MRTTAIRITTGTVIVLTMVLCACAHQQSGINMVGEVASVNRAWAFVVIKPFRELAIEAAAVLTVRRDNRTVGWVKTTSERNGMWVADIVRNPGTPIRKGDLVGYIVDDIHAK